MIWIPWRRSRPNSRSFPGRRSALAGQAARSVGIATLSMALSGTAMAYSLLQPPQRPADLPSGPMEEPPGYGVSGYFSLEGGTGTAIEAIPPRARVVRPSLDIRSLGRRVLVTSPQARGGRLALRLIDARGSLVRAWTERLPPGGAAVFGLGGTARGLLILHVEGGELGRAVKIIPPVGPDAG